MTGKKTWSEVWSEGSGKEGSAPKVNYTDARLNTDLNSVYGGIGELLKQSAPKKDPVRENELKRYSKYAALTDMFKTVAEGVALTAGQNTGNGAMPSVNVRGVNPFITYADQHLEKMNDQYAQDEKLYNAQTLAQKLRESNYLMDADKYNKNLGLQQQLDERNQYDAKYKQKYGEFRDEQDQDNKNRLMRNNEQAQKEQSARLQAERDKSRVGIINPYAKQGEDNRIYFDEPVSMLGFVQYLSARYPELAGEIKETVSDGYGGVKTTSRPPNPKEIYEAYMSSGKKTTQEDVNAAKTAVNDKNRINRQDEIRAELSEISKKAKEESDKKSMAQSQINGVGGNNYVTNYLNGNQPQNTSVGLPIVQNNMVAQPQYAEQNKQQNLDPLGL